MPHSPAPLPMTAEAYAALPEDSEARFELQEGALVMSPRPIARHQRLLARLCIQLDSQLPDHLTLLPEVDIDLELVAAHRPATVRAPDIVVVHASAYRRVDQDGGLLTASDVVLAVEILSPGSVRTDSVIKREEYADAGIPHYWILDVDGRPNLTVHHLAGEFGYAAATAATGVLSLDEPFPVRLDLDVLSE